MLITGTYYGDPEDPLHGKTAILKEKAGGWLAKFDDKDLAPYHSGWYVFNYLDFVVVIHE